MKYNELANKNNKSLKSDKFSDLQEENNPFPIKEN